MTRKHIIALAEAIKKHQAECGDNWGEKFTPVQLGVLADFCAEANVRFDHNRWLKYIADKCGPHGGAR